MQKYTTLYYTFIRASHIGKAIKLIIKVNYIYKLSKISDTFNNYFPIQKIVNPYISGLSEDWATNSQQQLIKQAKTLHKEKKIL